MRLFHQDDIISILENNFNGRLRDSIQWEYPCLLNKPDLT